MSHHDSKVEAREELWEKIKEVQVAMMTTIQPDGSLRSRPMWTQSEEGDFNGTIWFFTADESAKVDEIEKDRAVNLSYAARDKSVYVSVSGRAEVVTDRAKMKELWNPMAKAWFPDGLDTPELCLLRIDVEKAEYWDENKPKLLELLDTVRAVVTGTRPDGGENEKLEV